MMMAGVVGKPVVLVASRSATLRQPAPSPVLRLLWLGTPLPNLPMRYESSRGDAVSGALDRPATLPGRTWAVCIPGSPNLCNFRRC
jgi:hypothetical protein